MPSQLFSSHPCFVMLLLVGLFYAIHAAPLPTSPPESSDIVQTPEANSSNLLTSIEDPTEVNHTKAISKSASSFTFKSFSEKLRNFSLWKTNVDSKEPPKKQPKYLGPSLESIYANALVPAVVSKAFWTLHTINHSPKPTFRSQNVVEKKTQLLDDADVSLRIQHSNASQPIKNIEISYTPEASSMPSTEMEKTQLKTLEHNTTVYAENNKPRLNHSSFHVAAEPKSFSEFMAETQGEQYKGTKHTSVYAHSSDVMEDLPAQNQSQVAGEHIGASLNQVARPLSYSDETGLVQHKQVLAESYPALTANIIDGSSSLQGHQTSGGFSSSHETREKAAYTAHESNQGGSHNEEFARQAEVQMAGTDVFNEAKPLVREASQVDIHVQTTNTPNRDSTFSAAPKAAQRYAGSQLGIQNGQNLTQLSLMVYKIAKSEGIMTMAAAPCREVMHWMPEVVGRLEYELMGFRFYCIDTDESNSDDSEMRAAFGDVSGGFLRAAPDSIELVIPKDLDLVVSWMGIQRWGIRKAWRFTKALRRRGVRKVLFSSNPLSNNVDHTDETLNVRKTPLLFNDPSRVIGKVSSDERTQLLLYSMDNVREEF